MSDKFLSIDEICERSQLSRTSIWRLQNEGSFPRFENLTSQRKALKESVFEQWLNGRRDWG